MIMTTQKYPINVVYQPGKELVIPDMLSRAFLQKTFDNTFCEELKINFLHVMQISDTKLKKLKAETQSYHELQQLITIVQTGWPESKDDVPAPCQPY